MPGSYIRSAKRERGASLLTAVLLLVFGVLTAALVVFPSPVAPVLEDRAGAALADVKQALIGYAVQRGVAVCSNPGDATACAAELAGRPGELPCPDLNNDGIAEAKCDDAIERLGRVPWKTLGIPEPKDSSGETLWYAVALRFLGTASNPITSTSGIINSHTLGNIGVRAADAASVITPQAVAVLFSPGVAVAGQNRSRTTITACPGRSDTTRNLCPANYLESVLTENDPAIDGAYATGVPNAQYNDRLLYITAADIIPAVEMRVGTELKNLLLAYRQGAKCRCFPWADSWEYSGGIADIGLNRGRFPASQVRPVDWGTNTSDNKIPPLPAWITQNDWHNVVFYTAARLHTDQSGKNCYFCSSNGMLTVFDNEQKLDSVQTSALIFTPGLPRNGRLANGHPSQLTKTANHAAANDMRGYLDDKLNYNKYDPKASPSTACPGWDAEHASGTPSPMPSSVPAWCDEYVRPSARTPDRDRLHLISHCPADASALLQNAPCQDSHDPTKVSAVCAAIVASLQTCSVCKEAAIELTKVPCLNTLNSSNCDAPVATLKLCIR